MTAAERIPLLSVEDYLQHELASEVKHEYAGGYIYAMAGARTVHNRVAMSLVGALHAQLQGHPCEPFNSDMKVRIQTTRYPRFYYPDAMVVCQPNAPDDLYQDQPVVIAEVLSESTRRIDLGEKLDAYLTIPSLQVYLVIETDLPRVVAYRRTPDGAFESEMYDGLEAVVPLAEIAAELPLGGLFERVEFPGS
jgi:Uma2 family endonuclease